MTTFNITVFLLFSFFLKGTNTSETTPVRQSDLTSHATTSNGNIISNSSVSVSTEETQNMTEVSNSPSVAPSVQSENSTSNVTVSVMTESTVAVSTDDNSTSFSVTSSGQSAYSTVTPCTKESHGPIPKPTPTSAAIGANSLSVIAFAVIILILILVIVVVILVSVISLRFKHCGCQETPQDTSKARSEGPSESSHANGEKESITLVSMRSLYTEAGGGESSVQDHLQNESNEIDETINNFSK